MSQFKTETISQDQKKLLKLLAATNLGKLTGGTALSLQIGHRLSYDLDFVTEKKVTLQNVDTIKQTLKKHKLTQFLATDTQYTALADNVKIALFQDPVKLLHPTVFFQQAELVSIQDIFSTKLYILGRRATWRDYCDIAVCLDKGLVSLEQGIKEAVQRYQVAQRWILEPISFFDDIEMMPIEWIDKKYSDAEIKNILVKAVSEYIS